MTETAFRWGGVLLTGGAALFGIAVVLFSFQPVTNQAFPPGANLLLLIASILLLASLPAAYARQAASAGWLGLMGHGLLQTGMLFLVVVTAPPLLYPSLKTAPGESLLAFSLGIALTLGLLLTGLATVRAGVFPRWAGILLLAATFGFFFDFFIAEFLPPIAGQVGTAFFGVLLAFSLGWLGIVLAAGNLGSTAFSAAPVP